MPRVRAVARAEDCPPVVAQDAAVVFDVLRMSTAMLAAAFFGAAAILPVESVEDARARAAQHPGAWLAGERHNMPPPGFQRGNSPVEWTTPVPPGTRVVWTTTNGTRALNRVRAAGEVLVGALVNRLAVATWIGRFYKASGGTVWLLAAGRRGEPSPPDWWGVGAVVAALPDSWCDEAALEARDRFREVAGTLGDALATSAEGIGLGDLGFGADVAWAAGLDTVPVVLRRSADGWLRRPGAEAGGMSF
jgi:2-phosphosulfolactate phosphatase